MHGEGGRARVQGEGGAPHMISAVPPQRVPALQHHPTLPALNKGQCVAQLSSSWGAESATRASCHTPYLWGVSPLEGLHTAQGLSTRAS